MPYANASRPSPFVRQAPNDTTMSQSPIASFNNVMPAPGGIAPVPGPSASPVQYQPQAYQPGQQTFSAASPVAHHQMPAQHHQSPGMAASRPVQHNSFRQVYPQQAQQQQAYQQLQPVPQQGYQTPGQNAQTQFQTQQQAYPQAMPSGGTPLSQHPGANPAATPGYDPRMNMPNGRTPMAPTPAGVPVLPRGPYAYHLPDEVENSIPQEIRDRYPKDAQGKMLWFTTPPEDRPANDLAPESQGIGHSMTYTDHLESVANEHLGSMTAVKKKAYLQRMRRRVQKKAMREKLTNPTEQDTKELAEKAVEGLIHWTVNYETETEIMFLQNGIPYSNTFDNMGTTRWTHENAKEMAKEHRELLREEFEKLIRASIKK